MTQPNKETNQTRFKARKKDGRNEEMKIQRKTEKEIKKTNKIERREMEKKERMNERTAE